MAKYGYKVGYVLHLALERYYFPNNTFLTPSVENLRNCNDGSSFRVSMSSGSHLSYSLNIRVLIVIIVTSYKIHPPFDLLHILLELGLE